MVYFTYNKIIMINIKDTSLSELQDPTRHVSKSPEIQSEVNSIMEESKKTLLHVASSHFEEKEQVSHLKTSFDDRFVNYDLIHGITNKDWQALYESVAPVTGEHILEGCCGYGDATKHILALSPLELQPEKITLMDNSKSQLERAQKNLSEVHTIDFIAASMSSIPLPDSSQDKIVVKMGIHELPEAEQKKAFAEIYRVLKPGGRFIMWDLALYPETREFWNAVIRKKDELCGFNSLVTNRNFLTEQEIISLYADAGFKNVKKSHSIMPRLNMRDRYTELISKDIKENPSYQNLLEKMKANKDFPLSEIPFELQRVAEHRLQELMKYTREQLTQAPNKESIQTLMNIEDQGSTIIFTQSKGIFTGQKPSL